MPAKPAAGAPPHLRHRHSAPRRRRLRCSLDPASNQPTSRPPASPRVTAAVAALVALGVDAFAVLGVVAPAAALRTLAAARLLRDAAPPPSPSRCACAPPRTALRSITLAPAVLALCRASQRHYLSLPQGAKQSLGHRSGTWNAHRRPADTAPNDVANAPNV